MLISAQNKDGIIVIRNNGANEYFTVISNAVANSTNGTTFVTAFDASLNVAVKDVSIRKVAWSTDGIITIGRVVNSSTNTAMLTLSTSGILDLDALGLSTNTASDYPNCNLYITCSSANSTLYLKLKKHTNPAGQF